MEIIGIGEVGGDRRGRALGNEALVAYGLTHTLMNNLDKLGLIQKGLVACRTGSPGSRVRGFAYNVESKPGSTNYKTISKARMALIT